MGNSEVIAPFDPALSSAAAIASQLSLSAQYQLVGYGELRTWSGPAPGKRLLLAATRGSPQVGEILTLRVVIPNRQPRSSGPQPSLSWHLEGLEPLGPLPSVAQGSEVRVRVRATRARGRSLRVQVGPRTPLELALIDS